MRFGSDMFSQVFFQLQKQTETKKKYESEHMNAIIMIPANPRFVFLPRVTNHRPNLTQLPSSTCFSYTYN